LPIHLSNICVSFIMPSCVHFVPNYAGDAEINHTMTVRRALWRDPKDYGLFTDVANYITPNATASSYTRNINYNVICC